MWFKLFSAAAIVLSCCYIGYEMANSLKQRVVLLDGFIYAVSMTEDFISALSLPLADIYKSLSEHIDTLKVFFNNIANSPLSPSDAWKTELKTLKHLTDSDKKILISMAETLGRCDTESQLNSLSLAKKRLHQHLDEAKEKTTSDSRMYKSVGLFTGIGIAVLLI